MTAGYTETRFFQGISTQVIDEGDLCERSGACVVHTT